MGEFVRAGSRPIPATQGTDAEHQFHCRRCRTAAAGYASRISCWTFVESDPSEFLTREGRIELLRKTKVSIKRINSKVRELVKGHGHAAAPVDHRGNRRETARPRRTDAGTRHHLSQGVLREPAVRLFRRRGGPSRITTHQVEEIENILTDVMFINDGRRSCTGFDYGLPGRRLRRVDGLSGDAGQFRASVSVPSPSAICSANR